MNHSRFLFFLASVALLVPIVSGTLAGAVSGGDERDDSLYKHLSVFSEVLSLVRRTYVEETSLDALFAGAMDGSTDALDPLATYVPERATQDFARTLRVGTSRSGLHIVKERGIVYVLTAEPGSPAAAAGLRTGDILSDIDEVSTRRMPLWQCRGRFAEPAGTKLRLKVYRRGQAREVTLELADFAPASPRLQVRQGVPVIDVDWIGPPTPNELRVALEQIRVAGHDALILDLRGAAAGDPAAAYRAADLFADGKLGELRDRDRVLSSFDGAEPGRWKGRLVVLTDRGSQGASEVLAAVLEQAAGAELVGERTFGHAGRHSVVKLSTGAQVFLTDAFYTGPDGVLLNQGLDPTVAVGAGRDGEAGESGDRILERALELLTSEDGQHEAA